MFTFLKGIFRGLISESESDEEAAISAAVESVVDGVDPRIRLLSDYRTKLRPGVKTALAYAAASMKQIPGPIEVDQKTFGTNPLVRALFGSAETLQKTFSLSRPLIEFFQRPENVNQTDCYALLGMQRQERNTLGVALQGDIVRKDVRQVTVSFREHRLRVPAGTETDLRRAFQQVAFNTMVQCAAERIEGLRSAKNELEEQQRRLRVQLKLLRTKSESFESLVKPQDTEEKKRQDTARRLAEIEQKYHDTLEQLGTLDDQIILINRVLSRPEEQLRVAPLVLRLDKMGIKVDPKTNQRADEITLAEVEIGKHFRATGVFVKYPRSEMLPPAYYHAKGLAYLDLPR